MLSKHRIYIHLTVKKMWIETPRYYFFHISHDLKFKILVTWSAGQVCKGEYTYPIGEQP